MNDALKVPLSVHFLIHSDMDVSIAVLRTTKHEITADFPVAERSLIATTVSELARNIIKYATRGSIRLTRLEKDGRFGLEITAEDQGPGIADVNEAMRDHVSTGGTLGLGLSGVKRMMDEFQIDSVVSRGTRVTVRKWKKGAR